MAFKIVYKPAAQKRLKHLNKAVIKRILQKIVLLSEQIASCSLVAMKGQWTGCYRMQVGDYRVIYSLLHGQEILVIEEMGYRSDIYEE